MDNHKRRWRFEYDEARGRGDCCWSWTVRETGRLKIASLRSFATLDACITDARGSGFAFTQLYDIVFARCAEAARAATM